jgi:Protein of unknown function (DUF1761)
MISYLLAIVVSTISALLVQSIWYNPSVFGNQWQALTKTKKSAIQDIVKVVAFSSVVTAVARSLVLLLLCILLIPSTELEIISLAVIVWVGFILPEHIYIAVITKLPKQLLYIYAGCSLATVVAQSISLWLVLQFLNAPLLS